MYPTNKVIWSEGMLLQHQHLQQQERFLEHLVESRCGMHVRYGWGFTQLTLDEHLLKLGKISLQSCEGVMPDGTLFSLPAEDDLPLPLDVTESARDALAVLALPLRRQGLPEVLNEADQYDEDHARYRRDECSVSDSTCRGSGRVAMDIGKLRFRLAFAEDIGEGYTALGVARVTERRADNRITLDRSYVAPCLDYHAASPLVAFVDELIGVTSQRGDALARRLGEPGTGGVAEIADFLILQLINRTKPLLFHFANSRGLHPETLFAHMLSLAGELATFNGTSRQSAAQPLYRHDNLAGTFRPVMEALRDALGSLMDPRVLAVRLEQQQFGLHVGRTDPSLFRTAGLVLAARADMPIEKLCDSLPAHTKIGPVERIHDLVSLQLPGIGLRKLAVAPRHLPFRLDCSYFALDVNHELWSQLATSAGIALHVAGEFPGLELELWAIRQ